MPESKKNEFEDVPTVEREVIEKQIASPSTKVSYLTLYRYATKLDLLGLLLAMTLAAAGGAILPGLTILFGSLTSSFRDFTVGTSSISEARNEINRYSLYLFYLAIGEFFAIFLSTALFTSIGEHITIRTRENYLKAILRQNIAYFENVGAGEVSTRISSDINLIQDGISEKVAMIISAIAAFVAALIISFYKSWKLSLIVLSTTIAIVLAIGVGGKLTIKFKSTALKTEAAASNVAEETVASIRTTTAFGVQETMAKRYNDHLNSAESWGFRMRSASGVMLGVVTAIIYMEHALSFWQGSRFLVDGQISLSAVITIQIAIMMAGAYLAQMLPHLGALSTALAAGSKVFHTIDRKSPIDPFEGSGMKPSEVKGILEFHDVKFLYPSRSEPVFEDLSFTMPAGRVTAFVGPSGCGKSTIVSLMQRFYLPVSGSITLDGNDISELNIRWLRQHMSLVSQEPILFSGTVFENIEAGLIGTEHEHKTDEEKVELVIQAAKTSNAHDFISAMPSGYQTQVGDRGFLFSGGQKQRIAIARAIISDPKILLLDEATSALDSKSEGIVQEAIQKASVGRTTMIIAHRLSTIENADNIIVLNKGEIVEHGTHHQLIEKGGVYFDLVQAQSLSQKNEKNEELGFDETTKETTDLPLKSTDSPLTRSLTGDAGLEKQISNADARPSQEPSSRTSFRELIIFMWSLNRNEKGVLLIGTVFSILSGANQPVRGILFGHSIMALSLSPSQSAKIRHDSNFWSAMFLMLALVQMFALSGQGIAFALSSERLIQRAKSKAFRSILRQDIAFFDKKENSAGSLTALLSREANRIAGLSGATLGAVMVFLTTVLGSIGIALGFGWKLSLVCMSIMPVLVACGFLRVWVMAQFQKRVGRTTDAAAFACEATAAIRTVASLTLEERMLQQYHDLLVTEALRSAKFYLRSSAAYALSQAIMFAASALGFWYGGHLIADGEYSILDFFICFTETLFGAQAAGNIVSFAPELGSGRGAAERFKEVIETQPRIDSWSDSGRSISEVQGRIQFQNVHFRYPERPTQRVLTGLSFAAAPGQFVALVGASGCGKSTALALIERFYDPRAGVITLDGEDISSLNISQYRQQLALVSQDTTLYSGTIKENLCFDLDDVDETKLHEACKGANILDFIMSLPESFNTLVGPKGSSLSGGQRQRLAIARALLRDPKILLLDEATSALDTASEKVVEEALQNAAKGRTTIAIAHRLSSIYHADAIYVMEEGHVIESGTHEHLMAKQRVYWDMVKLQGLNFDKH
ncbi:P-loop containing nucleoside triphosphate hydrolase protein [Rhizodiscina lignyota]|uniref:P-loop containing nucleoside triphosphate hydrolase protein n=1 Tax=Rhizodiscina lignyota TaxID=1504668 RepID=A0A9P4MDD7_9PEZI|nr:P-loop containing nucleoside triphosphate hydrolase protein [Rhizodiscina lignyota]